MNFSGITKTSLVDFPDKIATVLFTPGCNLRCPFCHNWRIVVDPKPPFLDEEMIFHLLKSRKKYINRVVVTGGEPTLHEDLPKFLKKLKEQKFFIKLDTNGFFPKILKKSLFYLDYVALDVKTTLEKYKLLGTNNTENFLESLKILKYGKKEYELRTTIVPGFVDKKDLKKIGELYKGSKKTVLQQFVPDETLDKKFKDVKPYSVEYINKVAEYFKDFTEKITIRI